MLKPLSFPCMCVFLFLKKNIIGKVVESEISYLMFCIVLPFVVKTQDIYL